MQSIFCLQGNKPIPEDLWTLKLENCSLRIPEGKQQSQTVAAAHNNNTYRDRLYLRNTATKAKEFQWSTAGLLFQTFINSLFVEPYCCLSNVLEYATNSLKKNHHKFRFSTTILVDSQQTEPLNCTSRCGFFLFHSFSQSNLIQASRELKKLRQKKALFKEEFGEAKFRERMNLAPITNAHAPSGTACCARGRLPVPEVCPCFDPSSKAFPGHVHSLISSPDLPPSSPLLLLPLACHSPAPLLRCSLCSSLLLLFLSFFWSCLFLLFLLLAIIHKRNEPNLAIDLTIK